MDFHREIQDFVTQSGAGCTAMLLDGQTILKAVPSNGNILYILPAEIKARTAEEAAEEYRLRTEVRRLLHDTFHPDIMDDSPESAAGIQTVTIAEDRWRSQNTLYKARLMSHLGRFRSIFARNCSVERIDRRTANGFMDANHNYGPSVCRYCYGLTEKTSGRLVAAATFSNARKWLKEGHEIRSYEWIRYASENGTRIPGGMGKILKRFMEDIRPDDIMSYADLEWSDGDVYRQLGFREDGKKEPVLFTIDPENWSRKIFRTASTSGTMSHSGTESLSPDTTAGIDTLWYMNDGSLKYRLRLTVPE